MRAASATASTADQGASRGALGSSGDRAIAAQETRAGQLGQGAGLLPVALQGLAQVREALPGQVVQRGLAVAGGEAQGRRLLHHHRKHSGGQRGLAQVAQQTRRLAPGAGLDRPATLLPVLHELGARHVGYGLGPGHYDTVATALLDTLAVGLGAKDDVSAALEAVMADVRAQAPDARFGNLGVP